METKYILRAALVIATNKETLKEYTEELGGHPPCFDIDGTEEELFRKLNLQLCANFANRYSVNNKTDMLDELKKLKEKYNIK